MRQKIMKYVSNITMGFGIALSAYSFYIIISARAGLPEGVCPLDNSRPFVTAAIVLLVISFITSFFTKQNVKKDAHDKDTVA